MKSTGIRSGLDAGAVYAVAALGFSLPVSVALDNVLLGLVLLFWLAAGNYREKLRVFYGHPVSVAALVLYGLHVVGMAYGGGEVGEGLLYLNKYSDLLFIPVFLSLFSDETARRRGLAAFAAAMVLTLGLSYLLAAGLVPPGPLFKADAESPMVFKLQITHNILMAFAALFFAQRAGAAQGMKQRCGWGALAILAVINVLVMVRGRTGYVVLGALLMLFLYRRYRWQGVAAAVVLIGAAGSAAYGFSGMFQHRIDLMVAEAKQWQYGSGDRTSIGDRLNSYTTTLMLIREHPLAGVGTRGFPEAYAGKVRGTEMPATLNPHNQFLLTTVQLGVAGLAALLFLIFRLWRLARVLPGAEGRMLAQGLVLTFVAGSLFNSLLLDHTEGLFLAWMTGLLFAPLPLAQKVRRA